MAAPPDSGPLTRSGGAGSSRPATRSRRVCGTCPPVSHPRGPRGLDPAPPVPGLGRPARRAPGRSGRTAASRCATPTSPSGVGCSRPIVRDQLPAALAMKPDLVSIDRRRQRPAAARRGDPDALAALLEEAVVRVRATGADVLLATGMDTRDSPLVRRTRGRTGVLNSHVWTIARRHGAYVLDVWGMRSLRDWRMWAPDRIHLTTEGHRRVAQAALVALGLEPDDAAWDDPLTPLPPRPRDRPASLRRGLAARPRLPVGHPAAARAVVGGPAQPKRPEPEPVGRERSWTEPDGREAAGPSGAAGRVQTSVVAGLGAVDDQREVAGRGRAHHRLTFRLFAARSACPRRPAPASRRTPRSRCTSLG